MHYDKSKALFARASRVIPGGVCSQIRSVSEPVPLFVARAEGSRLWDVDGNEFIDYVLGQGPMLLGHTPQAVIEAVRRQAALGLTYGLQTEFEVRAAELIQAHVPCAERVRFNSTGSEAVHSALRLARAATGRKKVLRFEGHFHGWFDNIAWNPPAPGVDLGPREDPLLRPSSAGQQPEDASNLIVRPWNDLALAERVFADHGGEIAAVICDAFACASGLIPAQAAFLEGIRALCDAHGALLILDEVITGFRIGLSGAQGLYGVTPDLATFAKALGAGLPVSALVGKRDIMELIGSRKVVHAGTYNSNPLVMAGTVAALETLTRDNGAVLARTHQVANRLRDGLDVLARETPLPMTIRGRAPLFHVSFVPEGSTPIVDYRSYLQSDFDLGRRFWLALQERGVHVTSMGIWFVSAAHSDEDVDQTLDAARGALEEVARGAGSH